MNLELIDSVDYDIFHKLLEQYYREGEDKNTPQNQLDGFILRLFQMLRQETISGRLIAVDSETVGFVLWAIDTEQFAFSENPGMGTILEIGLGKPDRRLGLGAKIVEYVENQLRHCGVRHCYVSAYGPAQKFWSHCGYQLQGATAGNGLPIMIKRL